ncbi:methyl-accepting chemotaxis protein [Bosea caraganae]|nr:methyl-accepting chemotaxis protein [Bosea caraganae]
MLFALLGIAAGIGLYSAVKGLDLVHEIDKEAFAGLALSNRATLLSNRVAQTSLLSRFDDAATPRAIEAALDALDGSIELVDAARASFISSLPEDFRAENQTLDPIIRTFIAFQRDIVAMGRNVSPKAALIEASADAARENVRQILTITTKLTDGLDRRAQLSAAHASELERSVRWKVIITAISLPLAGAMLAIYLLRTHLTRPLRELMVTIAAATSSSAVIEVPHVRRKDEIGQLARTVRTLSEVRATLVTREAEADLAQLHQGERTQELGRIADEFEGRLGVLLRDIAEVSEILRAALQDSAVRAQQVSQSTATAASAVTGAGDEAQRITDAALRLEYVIQQINTEVRRVSETATAASQEAAGTSGLVRRLTENASQIRDVVEIIEAIARQTNLLALNATIEAARAGVHGRGFAVVASEVKALAGQTAEATAQIVKRISNVNEALSHAAQAVSAIVSSVGAVEQTSTEISTMVASHSELLGSLGDTVGRISHVTGTAAGAMAEIAKANVQGVAQADMGAMGARDLDERIAALQGEAVEFVRRLRAA